MSATKTQLIGGGFQDSLGNPLQNGTLKLHLSQDCLVSGVGTICSGIDIIIQLDSSGNVASSASTPPAANQFVWSNLVMTPQNNFYRVTGFTAEGQRAFGPNNQQVGSGATFNLGTWTPNTVISWFPSVQSLELEVRSTPLSSQTVLNFESSDSSITITDEGNGLLNFQSTSGLVLETNGTPNSSQSTLNLEAGANITLTDEGGGAIQIAASSAGFSGSGAFFFGPGVVDLPTVFGVGASTQAPAEGQGTVTANRLTVYLFLLTNGFTISKCTTQCFGNSAGATATFGIYSFSGNKLVDGGKFSTLTAPGIVTNTFTPVTLPQGTYWFAQACSAGNTAAFPGIGAIAGEGPTAQLAQYTTNTTRAATAANMLSAGTLPATLGTLTPFSPSEANSDGFCMPLFE